MVLFLFSDVFHDVMICYAFGHATDEIVDSTTKAVEEKKVFVQIMRKFLDQAFGNRKVIGHLKWKETKTKQQKIDWKYFAKYLSEEDLAVFKCFAQIVYYLPQEPFYELLSGFESDFLRRVRKDKADLIEYATNLSSILTPFLFICCNRCECWPDDTIKNFDSIFEKTRIVALVSSITFSLIL